MNLRILKFGGTSVADAEAINRVIDIVSQLESKAVIVVSACSQVTNKLTAIVEQVKQQNPQVPRLIDSIEEQHLQLSKQLNVASSCRDFIQLEIQNLQKICEALLVLGEVPKKHHDLIVSAGERLSSKIIAEAMSNTLSAVQHLDAKQLIITKMQQDQVVVNFEQSKKNLQQKLIPVLETNKLIVMAGFICSDSIGQTATLGRGGSDYSAAVLGNCLAAKAIEIWTDVDGILTSDPSRVSATQLISQLSYQEAAELAYFGAKVLHPKTLGPASRDKIPVYVKNTFNPEGSGTKILEAVRTEDTIKSIASRDNITVVNIHSNHMYGAYGFLRRVFEVFDNFHCPVDVVTTSEVSVSITIEDVSSLTQMLTQLNSFSNTETLTQQAIVAVVGDGLKQTTGIAATIFSALKDIPISMISMGASEVNLTLVVDENDRDKVIQKLHNAFFKG